ncbi:hypothetical protein [Streptomyces sp. NPDC051577]|uniref:hypothetical protein n=1 Tax=Streptomyces sp. NPDC051577 TaxID=3155166 RepID=UPI00344AC038
MTARSQADEGLQRARADEPTVACRKLLLRAADLLRADRARHEHAMDQAALDEFARRLPGEYFGMDSQLVEEVRAQFLDRAPAIRPGQTRAEYALVLRLTAGHCYACQPSALCPAHR